MSDPILGPNGWECDNTTTAIPVAVRNPSTGGIDFSVSGSLYGLSPKLYPNNGQIKWGSYGDSIANVSSYANFDLRQISGGSFGAAVERMGAWVGPLSNGLFRLASNCGISGETTAQMIARESAGSSATRKAIIDAASCGVQFLVNSFGINDIQTLASGASDSTIASTVATAVSNAVILLKKQKSYGIWPVTTSLFGYNYTGATAGEIATRQTAVRLFNTQLSTTISNANGALGSYVDVYSLIATSSGTWISGYDQGDGMHPGANGCKIIYAKVVQEMLRVAGIVSPAQFAYGLQSNLVTNVDLTSASSGTATGFNIYTSVGTCTLSKSIKDWRGMNWQEVIVTPTAFDGNGNAGVGIDITVPNATIALNDVLGGEVSLYIDDGNGNAPASVFQYMARLRANATYADTPQFVPTVSPKVGLIAPVDQRIALLPIVSPAATPATSLISVLALTTTTTPFRVMVALPRAFKLSATY